MADIDPGSEPNPHTYVFASPDERTLVESTEAQTPTVLTGDTLAQSEQTESQESKEERAQKPLNPCKINPARKTNKRMMIQTPMLRRTSPSTR